MKNLNEEINRFRQLLSAEHGVIKPYGNLSEIYENNSYQERELFYEEEVATPPPAAPAPPAAAPAAAPATGATGAVSSQPVTPTAPATGATGAVSSQPVTPTAPAQPAQPTEGEFYEDYDEYDEYEDDVNYEDSISEVDQMLQDAVEEGRDILEYEADMSIDDLNELSELDIADELKELGYTDLARNIEEMYEMVFEDPTKPYDSIGGHSPKDIDDAFNKMMKRNR